MQGRKSCRSFRSHIIAKNISPSLAAVATAIRSGRSFIIQSHVGTDHVARDMLSLGIACPSQWWMISGRSDTKALLSMQPLEETLIRLRMSVSGLRDASYIASTYIEAIRGSGCDLPSDSINRAWLGLMLLGMIRDCLVIVWVRCPRDIERCWRRWNLRKVRLLYSIAQHANP